LVYIPDPALKKGSLKGNEKEKRSECRNKEKMDQEKENWDRPPASFGFKVALM